MKLLRATLARLGLGQAATESVGELPVRRLAGRFVELDLGDDPTRRRGDAHEVDAGCLAHEAGSVKAVMTAFGRVDFHFLLQGPFLSVSGEEFLHLEFVFTREDGAGGIHQLAAGLEAQVQPRTFGLPGNIEQAHTDGSNTFIYSRFLTPYLCGFDGWALFADGDMVCRADIAELCPSLRRALLRYSQVFLTQIGQVAVCNNAHSLHQRLCRWLLVCRDRRGSVEIATCVGS